MSMGPGNHKDEDCMGTASSVPGLHGPCRLQEDRPATLSTGVWASSRLRDRQQGCYGCVLQRGHGWRGSEEVALLWLLVRRAETRRAGGVSLAVGRAIPKENSSPHPSQRPSPA